MKKETTSIQGNICKHCGEPYTTQERNRVYGNNVLMSGYCSAGCYTEGTLNAAAKSSIKDELDITKGEWVSRNVYTRDVIKIETSRGLPICSIDVINAPFSKSDAKAICTAVNSTYGKGYNPAVMEELFEALQDLLIECIDNDGDSILPTSANQTIAKVTSVLKNAKTIKP